jgi:predicted membrane-bound mannosyltransferase
MAIRKRIVFVAFLIIIGLGFFLRVWDLDKNPAGFFCDEASIGYNAYQILKTGQDEYGIKFPLYFRAFGEYKPPLTIYPTIVPIFFLGLNEFSVRLISVIFQL